MTDSVLQILLVLLKQHSGQTTFETPEMWRVSVFLSVDTDIFLCLCSIVFILGKKVRI